MRHIPNLLSVLFTSETRALLLSRLYLNEEREFYLNELSRDLQKSHGLLQRELDTLVKAKLVTRESDGNRVYFKANADTPVFTGLQSILEKTVGVIPAITEALNKLRPKPIFAFVYGSMASRKDHARSDVDLVVVADTPIVKIHERLEPISEDLHRRIELKTFAPTEFRRELKQDESFVQHILTKPIIPLIGTLDECR